MSLKQVIRNETLQALKRAVKKTIEAAAPHIRSAKDTQLKIIQQKFTSANNWYMQVTGLDKVYLAQDKVNFLQVQLYDIQAKRREVGKQLADIRQQSIQLQDEIHKVKRQEDLEKFLNLMTEETEILKLERSIGRTFQEYDQTERELFTAFTNAIRDSHVNQRAQMEYTKYLSISLSIIGSLLAFIYSSFKKDQFQQIVKDSLKSELKNSKKSFLEEFKKTTNLKENQPWVISNNLDDEFISRKSLYIAAGILSVLLLIRLFG